MQFDQQLDPRLPLTVVLQRLRQVLLLVLIAALLPAIYPLQPWTPQWLLRVCQALVEFAPAVLLALLLTLLADFFRPRAQRVALSRYDASRRFARWGARVYAVLLPVQLLAVLWLWWSLNGQVENRVAAATARLEPLIPRIEAAGTAAALQDIAPQAPQLPNLEDQREQLLGGIRQNINQVRSTVSQQRRQLLTAAAIATMRGLLTAAAMAAALRFAAARL
jgi:hypothetical protein